MGIFKIDRNRNFSADEVKKVLQIIKKANGNIEQIQKMMVDDGITASQREDFFTRSWTTFLKEYKLLNDLRGQIELTSQADIVLNDTLSEKEFLLLFLIDRVADKDDLIKSNIHPFEVLIRISKILSDKKVDNTISNSDFNYINMVFTNYDDIETICNKIVEVKQNKSDYGEVQNAYAFDIYCNLIQKVFDLPKENAIKLDLNNIMIQYIEEFYNKIKNNIKSDFISNIERVTKIDENKDIKIDMNDDVVKAYLIDGLSLRDLGANYLEDDYNGFKAQQYIQNLNINTNNINKGKYKAFKGYEGIIKYLYNKQNNVENNMIEIEKAVNVIYYGVPGCGKSYQIDNSDFKEKSKGGQYIVDRTVFHPDYTYSDFVGQIVPVIIYKDNDEKEIGYEFKAGPFTKILYEALNNSEDNYALIIEEINRGNASAIFGDIFQLLDRDDKCQSRYDIVNDMISDYFAQRYYDENLSKLGEEFNSLDKNASISKIKNEKFLKIKIPNNLSLVGTMNTCDQNVFPLDTAFKRRWELKRIKNEFKETDEENVFKNIKVCGSSITWEKFNQVINKAIIDSNNSINTDDKRLGVHFVTKEEIEITNEDEKEKVIEKFAEKVLMYLWNDVAKLDLKKYFKINENIKSFDDMIDVFLKKGKTNMDDAFKAVFNEKIYDELFDVKKENTTPKTDDDEPIGESGENN